MATETPLAIQAMYRLGYEVNTEPFGGLNVFGIRSAPDEVDERDVWLRTTLGHWDDRIGVAWWDGKYWRQLLLTGTTDPGRITRKGQRGTAVMKPGQYVDAYQLGAHRGHPALVNWGKCAPDYWRVVADDVGNITTDSEGSEYIGLNIHRGSTSSTPPEEVGPWSRGCQVIQDIADWDYFYTQVERLAIAGSKTFITYTLLTEAQVLDVPEVQGGQDYLP